jgi:hypothetical protein
MAKKWIVAYIVAAPVAVFCLLLATSAVGLILLNPFFVVIALVALIITLKGAAEAIVGFSKGKSSLSPAQERLVVLTAAGGGLIWLTAKLLHLI